TSPLSLPEEAMRQKISRLRLEVVVRQIQQTTTSNKLPSVEEALKDLVAAMNALKMPGLSKTEIMRLRSLIQTSGLYQHRLAEYVDFRGIERETIDLTETYEELAKREQDRSVTPRIAGKGFTRSRTVLRNGPRPASFMKPTGVKS
ncbi:hypothetical protein MUP38_00030, partial [Candidatus Bathyarchaeota archaeon]|nr:hypothetical protein [Candidatus Bathyarchaeota archaeon]